MSDYQQPPAPSPGSQPMPPPPSTPASAPEPPPAASGKRWSTAQLALASVVTLIIGVGIGAAGASDDGESITETAATATTETPTTTEREPTTTTEAPTTTTTEAPTTTTTAAPTPESVAAEFATQFEASRLSMIDVLEGDSNIQSLDRFEYDPGQGAIILAVTSRWASPDNQDEGAWEITRLMATLWSPADGAWYDPVWTPSFQLMNSGRSRNCSGEFMVSLGDRRSSQADWVANCG